MDAVMDRKGYMLRSFLLIALRPLPHALGPACPRAGIEPWVHSGSRGGASSVDDLLASSTSGGYTAREACRVLAMEPVLRSDGQ